MIPTLSYKRSNYFLYLILFLSISFLNGQSKQVSFSYNKINLQEAIQQLIDTYQLPVIYPSNLEQKKISVECNNQEKVNVWESYKQAEDNSKDYEPVGVIKRNNAK